MNGLHHDGITAWLGSNHLGRALDAYRTAVETLVLHSHAGESRCSNIILGVRDPEVWIGYALAAIEHQQRIWFCSPHWGQQEWEQTLSIVKPDLLWVDPGTRSFSNAITKDTETRMGRESPGIMIPTGGSSGSIRFAWHTMHTLSAAVNGMARFFYNREPQRGDFGSICRLPLWHVSGWMQLIRALVTDSEWRVSPPASKHSPNAWEAPGFHYSNSWLSLVPAQLSQILTSGALSVLRSFDHIVLGGGACPRSLLEALWQANIYPWITYGLTETAGMVAATRPEREQVNGGAASIFPHAEVREMPASGAEGLLGVRGPSCCLGYNGMLFSQSESQDGWVSTGDLGRVDPSGLLHISGRGDRLINTGGEKVSPEEVESVLRTHASVSDCHVGPVPDSTWGQRVGCLVVVNQGHVFSEASLQALLKNHLSPFKIPRKWIVCDSIPVDAKGKRSWRTLDALLQN